MRTADFDFQLPPELIAQIPAPKRDQSRLLVLHRDSQQIEHRKFRDLLAYLHPGDVLVLNDSRVFPARLRGTNAGTGGQFEILLLQENATNDWWVMMRPAKRARTGTRIIFHDVKGKPTAIQAIVLEHNEEGHRRLQFTGTTDIAKVLDVLGEVPLPPYINRARPNHQGVSPSPLRKGRGLGRGVRSSDVGSTDRERYQTVFAHSAGSVAAPTAGLHFTESLLDEIRLRGVQVCFLTLHVGLGTFAPVKAETLAAHTMHEERYELSQETARIINQAKQEGRRVIAVGTTSLRVLESVAAMSRSSRREEALTSNTRDQRSEARDRSLPAVAGSVATGPLLAGAGRTRIFIHPPYDFKISDALLTNFHLPRSTLLMLVSAFAAPNDTRGRELILSAYKSAIQERYRFFSYGDAMLLV
jgi:S-adenosylmethionine:tRNA ribosyltransferase-isomerase